MFFIINKHYSFTSSYHVLRNKHTQNHNEEFQWDINRTYVYDCSTFLRKQPQQYNNHVGN